MKPFSGSALNSYRSIQIGADWRGAIRYQNPFEKDPYTQASSRKDLCQFWALENKIRLAELEKYRKENG